MYIFILVPTRVISREVPKCRLVDKDSDTYNVFEGCSFFPLFKFRLLANNIVLLINWPGSRWNLECFMLFYSILSFTEYLLIEGQVQILLSLYLEEDTQ